MSARKIKSALKKRGLVALECYYGWQATPGEMVPGWTVYLDADSTDRYEEATEEEWRGDYEDLAEVIEAIELMPVQGKEQAHG